MTKGKTRELRPFREFVIEAVKGNPELVATKLRKMLVSKFGKGCSGVSYKTLGNWIFEGRMGKTRESFYRKGLPAIATVTLRKPEKPTAPPPATIVTAVSSMDIAVALLNRVVHALNNSDLQEAQLRESKSRIARFEERITKVEGERDRVLKLHNEFVRESKKRKSDEPPLEIGEIMRLAHIRDDGGKGEIDKPQRTIQPSHS